MSTEEKKIFEKAEQAAMLDGFDTYGDELDTHLLQGTLIKFTLPCTWVTRAGEEMPTGKEFIALDVKPVEAKWPTDKNASPQTRVLLPGEKFRDVKTLNGETPKSEWREYNGQLKGPWENQFYLYLLDQLMKRYTYVASTVGGHIAVRELIQQVKDARLVYALIFTPRSASPTLGCQRTTARTDCNAPLHHHGLHQKARRATRRQTRAAQPHRIGKVGASR
jgi:hypothetical protein